MDPTLGPQADDPGARRRSDGRALTRPERMRRARAAVRRRGIVPLVCAVVVAALVTTLGPSAHLSFGVTRTSDTAVSGNAGNLLASLEAAGQAVLDAPATAPPAPAPPSLADAPPLKPHEVFGFAPYWTLGQSSGFNLAGISTLAYFSLGVNPDGTLNQSGPGWTGYQSQALANLVTAAHATGDRVVLTVNNFDQRQLDALTSSPTAGATLANAILGAVEAKNLDGVNLDFEGQGSADNAGLTNLVDAVSWVLHTANPHYQVTMDTYSSSASGSNGWLDIPALAGAVDAFFIMEYNPNLAATQGPSSPLTSGMFSDQTAVSEYTAVVPPSKVILGVPFFGIDWPTSDGTLNATATGPATDVSIGDIDASGHPQYWDPVTNSGWTSYQVGTQWHETFFEDPASLYKVAQLAQAHGLAGVGVWALGMDGASSAADLAALLGFAPAIKNGPAGPASTPPSPPAATSPPPSTPSPTNSSPPPDQSQPSAPAPSPTTTTTTTAPATSTTTTAALTYSGQYNGAPVQLTKVTGTPPAVSGTAPVGQLNGFATQDPAVDCLTHETGLRVWAVSGSTTQYLVETAPPADCTTADFVFTTP